MTFSHDLETRLNALAKETGRPVSEHIEIAVAQYFDEMEEDRQDLESAVRTLEEVAREGAVPWEDVKKELQAEQ